MSKSKTLLFVAALLTAATGLYLIYNHRFSVAREFVSPDKQYAVVVYKDVNLSTFPGQGSDAAGFAVLESRPSRKVLQKVNVDLAREVSEVIWEGDHVILTRIAEWPLPTPISQNKP